MSIAQVIAVAVALGVLVGIATELTRGREKAHSLPGGSLTVGLLTGALLGIPGNGLVSMLVGAASGLAGWLLYSFLPPLKAKK